MSLGEVSHLAKCRSVKCRIWQNVARRNVVFSEMSLGEMSLGKVSHSAKCRSAKCRIWQNVARRNVVFGEMSLGEMSFGEMSLTQFKQVNDLRYAHFLPIDQEKMS